MSVCKPIYPEGSLRKDNLPIVPNYEDLVAARYDRSLRYNMEEVRTLNTLNNALLLSVDLTPYPTLKNRFDQSAITDEEYVDFLFTSVNDTTTIKELFLSDFPVQFNFDDLVDILGGRGTARNVDLSGDTTVLVYRGGVVLTEQNNSTVTISDGTTLTDGNGLTITVDNGLTITSANGNTVSIEGNNKFPIESGTVFTSQSADSISVTAVGQVTLMPLSESSVDNIVNTGGITFEDIDTVPIDRFVPGIGYSNTTDWVPGSSIVDYLNQLDFFLSENFSAAIRAGVCAAFTNPFSKISSLIALAAGFAGGIASILGGISSIINDIKNFSLSSLISDLNSKLQSLASDALNLIGSLKNQLLSKLNSIESTLANIVNNIKSGGQRIYKYFKAKIDQVRNFFSEENMQALRDKVKGVFDMNQAQFEELLPNVLNSLALKVCGVTNYIDTVMQGPVNKISDQVNNFTLTFDIQAAASISITNRALQSGAIRVNPTTRIEVGNRSASTANRVNGNGGSGSTSIAPSNFVTVPITDNERQFVQSISSTGNQWFVFSEGIREMGQRATSAYQAGGCGVAGHSDQWDAAENTPDAGWAVVAQRHPGILAMLKRVSTRLQEDGLLSDPLTLNSLFRSRYYNRVYLPGCQGNRGAAQNSLHMSAMAVDVSTRNLSALGTAKLVQYASQEGFNRMSVYNTFVHMDIKDGSYRGNWTNNFRGNADIRRAIELHLTRQHTEGSR